MTKPTFKDAVYKGSLKM